jgi:hypothetical protein
LRWGASSEQLRGELEQPGVGKTALLEYLASHPGEVDSDEDPDQVIRRAVRAQWRDDVPGDVAHGLSGR